MSFVPTTSNTNNGCQNGQKLKVFSRISHPFVNNFNVPLSIPEQHAIPPNIISATSTVDMNEFDQSLMYSQLLTEILLEMNYEKAAKREFIELYRKQYADSNV